MPPERGTRWGLTFVALTWIGIALANVALLGLTTN